MISIGSRVSILEVGQGNPVIGTGVVEKIENNEGLMIYKIKDFVARDTLSEKFVQNTYIDENGTISVISCEVKEI